MWILTNSVDPIFLRVTDDEGEKQAENQCPVLKTLDSSLNDFVLKLNSYFLFFFLSFLHPQPVKETAINNRTYFGDFGSEKNLAFLPPRVIYIYKMCSFFYLCDFEN